MLFLISLILCIVILKSDDQVIFEIKTNLVIPIDILEVFVFYCDLCSFNQLVYFLLSYVIWPGYLWKPKPWPQEMWYFCSKLVVRVNFYPEVYTIEVFSILL